MKYEGETDSFGRRHGRGKLTYPSGSFYNGDWDCGLRHGVGEFHSIIDGKRNVYRGQWFNDLKHGIGEEEYADKKYGRFKFNKGLWYRNNQNGVARLKEQACCCPK